MREQRSEAVEAAATTDAGPVAFSNGIRLTGREWLVVALFTLLLFFAPALWKQVESCPLESDHRMPHDLSNDYWLYERFAALAADRYDTIVIGDSVVWGDTMVWGSVVFNGSLGLQSVVWGSSVVWGDTTNTAFSVVWGDAVNVNSAMTALSADDGDEDLGQ